MAHNCIAGERNKWIAQISTSWNGSSIGVYIQGEFVYYEVFPFQRTWKWMDGKDSKEKIQWKTFMGPAAHMCITPRTVGF